jgi:hypothetical protein
VQADMILFPPGSYPISAPLTVAHRNVDLVGFGPLTSKIEFSHSTGSVIVASSFPSFTYFSIADLGIFGNGAVDNILSVNGAEVTRIRNCWFRGYAVNTINLSSCNAPMITGNRLESFGGRCLRMVGGSGYVANNNMRRYDSLNGGTNDRGANTYISNCNSIMFGGNQLQGGGYEDDVTANITSGATSFTVNTSSAHGLVVFETIVIHDANVAGYNRTWQIASVPNSTSFTVGSTASLGASTAASAARMMPCLFLSPSVGPVNECGFDNNLFSNFVTNYRTGTVSVYLSQGNSALNNNRFTDCMLDYGQTGFMLQGNHTGSSSLTINGFQAQGGQIVAARRGVHVAQSRSVQLTGLNIYAPRNALESTVDRTSNAAIEFAGTNFQPSRNLMVTGCAMGGLEGYDGTIAEDAFAYGLRISGDPDNVTLTGNHIHGNTTSVDATAFTGQSAAKMRVAGNHFSYGTTNDAADMHPAVASGATMTLPFNEIVTVTGTSNVDTIAGGWNGREVSLLMASTVSFTTAGNIAVARTTVPAGTLVKAVFDSSKWHLG